MKSWLKDSDTVVLNSPITISIVYQTYVHSYRPSSSRRSSSKAYRIAPGRHLFGDNRGNTTASYASETTTDMVLAYLQHVQQCRLSSIIETEEQQLGVLVQKAKGG